VKGIDAVTYFDIAHSVLFDHDFNLNNEFERMKPEEDIWTARQPETGLPGSVWAVGYSLLQIPLLALGTGVDALAGNPADGFSQWALFFYCMGNLLMVGCGMAALFTFLQSIGRYWKITPEDHQSAYALFVTFVIFFATNVGYYTFSRMSHSSTFLFSSLFLLTWWRVRDSDAWRDWLLLGLIGGTLAICRWQDILYIGGPPLYDLLGGDVVKKPLRWWRARVIYVAAMTVCWIPQMLEWKAIFGHYVTNPVGRIPGAFFKFPPEHILQLLLSSHVGWFIWSPVTVLGVIGLFPGAFKATRIYLPWIVVLALEITVIGSVTTWDGGDSFGARYLLSSTPLVAFGIMTLFALSAVWVRRSLAVACAACCVFTVLFAVQFRMDLVPKGDVTLTFSELFTDKLRLGKVRQRKAAARQAQELLAKGDPEAAIRILEGTLSFGEDREVDRWLEKAYRAAGRTEQASAVEVKYKKFVESALY